MFRMELTLNDVKRHIIENMFPSYEDGNPDDYGVFVTAHNWDPSDTIVITREIADANY